MRKLWVFGPSMCLPHDLKDPSLGWPSLLANKLSAELRNMSQVAVDNLYIYSCYLEHSQHIDKNDVVVIGWSHPSRKSFVYDPENPKHVDVSPSSFNYNNGRVQFIRSKNTVNDTAAKWSLLSPKNSGKKFYDTWFNDYYSDYEQNCNLQSYYDSVKLTCSGFYIPFFFSEESVKDVTVTGAGYMLEFVTDNNVAIADNNMHLNEQGHIMWADNLLEYYDTISNNRID